MVVARDHKDMNGSLRINITEGDRARITGHDGRRYLGGGNAAEQAIGHVEDLNVYRAGNAADIYGCFYCEPTVHHPSGAAVSPGSGFPSLRDESCAGAGGTARIGVGVVDVARRAGLPAEHREDS